MCEKGSTILPSAGAARGRVCVIEVATTVSRRARKGAGGASLLPASGPPFGTSRDLAAAPPLSAWHEPDNACSYKPSPHSTTPQAPAPSMTDSAPMAPPTTRPSAPSANRLFGILHGCLKSHTRYDEQLAWHTEPEQTEPCSLTASGRGMSSQASVSRAVESSAAPPATV